MTTALCELTKIAASGRDARLFSCLSNAHMALGLAQRGNISGTVRFLVRAQLEASRHQGFSDDHRALVAMGQLRRECASALTTKIYRQR